MACVTQNHPCFTTNWLIIIVRYLMAKQCDEVKNIMRFAIHEPEVAE
jgi:hypothetical protein